MPEFEQRKRRSLSDQELYDEYYGNNKKSKQGSSKKGTKGSKKSRVGKNTSQRPPQKREPVPVSSERRRLQQENNIPSKSTDTKQKTTKGGKSSSRNTASKKDAASKRKKHGSYILYYILCGIIVVSVVVILSSTVLFNINTFEVTGETRYSEQEIIQACGITEGENLLRINPEKAGADIVSKLVYIDAANVSRGFPDKLKIEVVPAKVMACYAVSGKYYLVSEIGRLLEITDRPADCPLVKGYVRVIESDPKAEPESEPKPETDPVIGEPLAEDKEKRMSIAKQIIEHMKANELNKDYEIDLTDTLNIKIEYDGGRIRINLETSADLDVKIQNAGYLIKHDVADTERCTLTLINPYELVKKPIYDEQPEDSGFVVTESPEETETSEGEEEPEEGSAAE